jgi:hypothetical protein
MKHLSKTLTLAVAALSMSAAQAIDKSTPKILLDNGFGSKATYGYMDYVDETCIVLGQKNDMFGRSLPMMWQHDATTGVVTATELPLPSGFSGIAMGWAELPNNETIVTGNLVDNNSNSHAVVWRSVNYGPWEPPVRLSPFSAIDICGHETQHGVQADVAGSVFQNGAWRPVVFTIKQNLDITHTFLPAPSGGGSASAIDRSNPSGDRISIGGYIVAANGSRRPTVWSNDGSGWQSRAIAIPNNASGQVNGVYQRINGGDNVVGEVARNGCPLGIWVPQGSPAVGLNPLPGFDASTAYSLGDTGTHEVGHIWGDSSTCGVDNSMVSTVWLPMGSNQIMHYAMNGFMADPGSVSRVTSFRPGGGCVVGSVIPLGGSLPQACLFLPSGSQAPDRVDVLQGRALGEGSSDISPMVHNDGEIWAAATTRVGGQRMLSLQLEFNPISFTAGQDARMDALLQIPQVGGATVDVYCFNYTNQTFVPFYTNNPGGGLLGISAALPASCQDPNTGQVRIKLEFKHGGSQPKAIGIETMEIVYEGY